MDFLAAILSVVLLGVGCMVSSSVAEFAPYALASLVLLAMTDAKRVRVAVFVAMLGAGCGLPQKAEEHVRAQLQVADGMAASIEGRGVRVPTYDELVLYVYALRYAWHSLAYAAELTDTEPNRDMFAPPGGWPELPVLPPDVAPGDGVAPADVAPVESGR